MRAMAAVKPGRALEKGLSCVGVALSSLHKIGYEALLDSQSEVRGLRVPTNKACRCLVMCPLCAPRIRVVMAPGWWARSAC